MFEFWLTSRLFFPSFIFHIFFDHYAKFSFLMTKYFVTNHVQIKSCNPIWTLGFFHLRKCGYINDS